MVQSNIITLKKLLIKILNSKDKTKDIKCTEKRNKELFW